MQEKKIFESNQQINLIENKKTLEQESTSKFIKKQRMKLKILLIKMKRI